MGVPAFRFYEEKKITRTEDLQGKWMDEAEGSKQRVLLFFFCVHKDEIVLCIARVLAWWLV